MCGEEGCVSVWGGGMCVGECGEEGCVWVCRGRKRRLCVCVCCMQTCISACVFLEEGMGVGGITHS